MKNIYIIKVGEEVKVGQTERSWEEREKEYETHLSHPKLLHFEYDCDFTDKDIKKILINDFKYKTLGEESYKLKENETEKDFCNVVKSIIVSLKTKTSLDLLITESFSMREEQEECVNKTYDAFIKQDCKSFLWNCKMRFGKTFTSYQLVKKLNYKKVLILTWKVAVEDSWKNDLIHHIDFKNYNFINKDKLKDFNENNYNIVFISIPLLLANKELEQENIEGDNLEKDKELTEEQIVTFKNKLKNISNVCWDLLIIDEAHYGTRSNKTEKILKVLEYNKKLELSGTPFKILNDNEYSNEEIYNWTYSDEQKKKKENEYLGERNPYKDLPEMKIWTFDGVRKLLDNSLYEYDFNLNDLFTTRKYKREMADLIEFSNLESVKRLIDFLCGNKFDLIEDRDIKESNVILPYFQDMRDKNKKSLWFLPNVDSVRAMENLLRNHIFFKDYYIINATGKGEGSSKKSLEKYNEVEKTKDKIIILSCGMLNTGVTMKSLNSVIVLQQKNSVQDFFQSIFRCQSPNPPSKKFCYVFDFNPKKYFDNIIEFVKTNYNKDNDDKKNIEDNLIETFLYLDGKMEKTTYETLMSYVTLDNNPEKIKKSFEKANMMNIDLLYSFKDNKEIMDIIDSIPMYRNEKNTIKEEENKKEKPLKDETEEEKKKRLEKEKERKIIQQENKKKKKETDYDIRKQKLNVLISSLSIFIYITNAEEKNLKEIINTREKELFKKICFVSIDNFNKLYENKFFKEEILSKAIYSFWKEERISRDWNELIEDRVVGIK